jgi:hypothetical protein
MEIFCTLHTTDHIHLTRVRVRVLGWMGLVIRIDIYFVLLIISFDGIGRL